MFRKITKTLFILAFIGLTACSGKNPSTAASADQNPNLRSFPFPYQKVYKTTVDIVEYEFLMGIELQDPKRGIFSTEMVRDYQAFQKRRFRLSGTVVFNGKESIVKLYKHEEVLIDNVWKAIPSDSSLENQILNKISAKLK